MACRGSAMSPRSRTTLSRAMSRRKRRRSFTASPSTPRRWWSIGPRPSGCASPCGTGSALQLDAERETARAAARALQRDEDLLLLLLGDVGLFQHLADLLLEHHVERLVAEGQTVIVEGC